MTSESAESTPADAATAATAPAAAAQAPDAGAGSARKAGAGKASTAKASAGKSSADKPRAGVPVWRVGKPDAFLAAAVDAAREAVATIAGPGEIGAHLAAKSEGDRVVTHLFESRLSGYLGWQWYAVVTRNSRSKIVTVSELGLLPSEDSILAPEWIPWAKRVRPEDETPVVEESVEGPAGEAVEEIAAEAADGEGPDAGAAAVEPDDEDFDEDSDDEDSADEDPDDEEDFDEDDDDAAAAE
ncbi:DUF3027 domain-containing protein [Arthrobacter sp. CJ23]|uniref:DUF3027 domain-containing protein n=1 Tax=Arthrobacter sp. CJ23 TaxID=2972479 RepID=UPI00215CA9E8|nr:DUF3027 domain-containing protein [Arthrobacter sp. CJ23]UVJ40412.1 DUF3027 domain-containing protein [Arthrobacter sp. CJ23]